MSAWNAWYHVTVHVYGSWLRGDPRGWRARHHREHVEGDYKHPPPPGTYTHLHQYSQSLMKRDRVRIEKPLRQFVVDAIVERLKQDQIQVAIASLDSSHLHILARFPDHNVNHWIGLSKKHASHLLRQTGQRTQNGGLWAKRNGVKPITDASQHQRATNYIADHASKGAALCKPLPAEPAQADDELAQTLDAFIEAVDSLLSTTPTNTL